MPIEAINIATLDFNHLQKELYKFHNLNYVGNKTGLIIIGNFDFIKTE